jgi:hypothetical protein
LFPLVIVKADVLDAELAEPIPQAVTVQAELAAREGGPVDCLLLHPRLRREHRTPDAGARHDDDSVVVSHHHVASVNRLATEHDRNVHRPGGRFDRTLRTHRPRPHRKPHLP